jgi:hypothetical protein
MANMRVAQVVGPKGNLEIVERSPAFAPSPRWFRSNGPPSATIA